MRELFFPWPSPFLIQLQINIQIEKKLLGFSIRPDHLNTCTAHSGAKKAHDWMVDQVAALFRTTHKVKTQQVVKSRGQHCGDIELAGYLANAAGPVPLVLDLRIANDRVGSIT